MNKSHIIHSMMIRTKQNNVIKRFFTSLFPRDNMTNIIRRLIPTTNNAYVSKQPLKFLLHTPSKITGIFINAFIAGASISAKGNANTFIRTIFGLSLSAQRIIKRLSAHFTISSFPGFRVMTAYRLIEASKRTEFPSFCLVPSHCKFFLTYWANQSHSCSFRQTSNFTLSRTINALSVGIMLKRFSTKLTDRTDLFRMLFLIVSPTFIRTKILSSLHIARLRLKLFSTSFANNLNRHVSSLFSYLKLTHLPNKTFWMVKTVA